MVVGIVQVITGFGLGATSCSSTITAVSIPYALAIAYCVYHAWWYAAARDIPKHKYWVLRLVGYLQAIAGQRFWLVVLMISHRMGCNVLYPPLDGMDRSDIESLVMKIFDDSFVLALSSAIYITEWYLAGMIGMLNRADPSLTVGVGTTCTRSGRGEDEGRHEYSPVPDAGATMISSKEEGLEIR